MAASVTTCPSCGTKTRVPAVAKGRPRCPQCQTDLPWLVAADDENFDEVADSAKVAVLVDLWAPWCGPCRQVAPLLERLSKERAGRVKVVKVNVDNAPGTQQRFRVQAIPTLVLMAGGKEVAQQAGAMPWKMLNDWVDKHLPAKA